jgi:hypothetical protein
MTRLIRLSETKSALVDADRYDELANYRWKSRPHRTRPEKNGYVYCYSGNRTIYLHRLVMGEPVGRVDHRNGDPFDNRRDNLRIATQTQNLGNMALSTRNRSGYKGVSFDKRKRKWRATLLFEGKHHHLGYFSEPRDAAMRYDEAARQQFGEFARTNFVR